MYWKGNNKLWWRNRIMFGTSWLALLFTSSLHTTNAVLFLVFVIPYFVEHYTVAMLILPLYLQIASTAFLIIASTMDPGIIPRRIVRMHKRYNGELIFYRLTNLSDNFRLKFWTTWFIMRPPRASHWPSWNNWVGRWDHHCPWMGTWIGRRNFKYFYYFLLHIALY